MISWNWHFWKKSLIMTALAFVLSCTTTNPSKVIAADTLNLRLGVWQLPVKVDDVRFWLETGEIPPSLRSYSWLLTPEVRERLQQRFHVDEMVAHAFLEQLWECQEGEQLLKQLTTAFPNSDPKTLKKAISLSWEYTEEFSFLSFLRAYPENNLTVDIAAVAKMGLQFQSASLQKQLLSPQLTKAFKDKSEKIINYSFDPTQSAKNLITVESLAFKDRKRQRIIPVDIYYSNKTTGPLVVMSHGFAADRQFSTYLARHLASYGFTVVSIEHPGSNIQALVDSTYGMNLNDILPATEFIDRPQDVSFILDELTTLGRRIPRFKGKFKTHQVSMIGHSFGGYTAFALAGATLNLKALRQFCQQVSPLGRSPADWLQCAAAKLPYAQKRFRDHRIKQVIAFNPIMGQLFEDLSAVTVPSLILSSTEDGITPIVAHQLQPFQQLGGEKYLLLGIGGTHMSMTDMSNLNSAVAQSTLVREVMGKDAEPVRNIVKGVSLAFIKQLTPESQQYQSFLSNHYVQSLSSEKIQFHWAARLPLQVQLWINTLDLGQEKLTASASPKKESLISHIWNDFARARRLANQPEYCTRQVDDMLTVLLRDHS